MPSKTKSFLPFSHPLELLSFYDEDILEGRCSLYPWQREISKEFSRIPSQGEINEIDLVTNNNSGKSKMIVSPAIAWIATQFDLSETVLTSASGSQVDNQTGRYLKNLCQRMNSFHSREYGYKLWDIQYRKLHFKPTNSFVDIFATDEGTKAEGWHQTGYDTAFAKIVDEAKAVGDNIFEALDRCLDAQWYLRVSSPRIGTQGYFYNKVVQALNKVFRITAYQCPHISKSSIDKIIAQYGLHSPITRSIIFAEFSSADESIVIDKGKIKELVENPPLEQTKGMPKSVGCDMAAGGDENVITYFEGNRQMDLRGFRERDTVQTKNLIVQLLTSWGIPKDCPHLNFDDGHVGHAIIDMLWRDGWAVKRKVNQSAAIRLPDMYANRGAEMWWSFANFVNNKEVILLDDPELIKQLGSRYYEQKGVGSKIKLEGKQEARAKGHHSPDRADATVLALSDFQSPFFVVGEETNKKEVKGQVTQKELVEFMDQLRYSKLFGVMNGGETRFSGGALTMRDILGEKPREAMSDLEEQLRKVSGVSSN